MILQPLSKQQNTSKISAPTPRVLHPLSSQSNRQPVAPIKQPVQPTQPQSKTNPIVQQAQNIGGSIFGTAKEVTGKAKKAVTDFIPQIPGLANEYKKAFVNEPKKTFKDIGKTAALQTATVGAVTLANTAKLIGLVQKSLFEGNIYSKGTGKNLVLPERWDITKQADAFKGIVKDKLNKVDPENAGTYMAAAAFINFAHTEAITQAAATAAIGTKLAIPIANKYLAGAVKFLPSLSETIGFVGAGQIVHDEENGSRANQVKNDLILLAGFKTLGFAAKTLSKSTTSLIDKALSLAKGKKVAMEKLEPAVAQAKQAIQAETGKAPEIIAVEKMTSGKSPKVDTKIKEVKNGTQKVSTETKVTQTQEVQAVKGEKAQVQANRQDQTVKDLSSSAVNSLENKPVGIKPGALERAIKEIKSGIKPPVKIRQIEGGKIAIEDGRNHLEGARKLGLTNYPIEDVTHLYTKPKIVTKVEVPRSQLPVGTGKQKVSRLEARVTESLDKAPQEVKDQLGTATYNQMSKKENIAKAAEYVTKNPDDALAVLAGEKEAPAGILRNSLYVVMENEAKGNVELARRLASLSSTRLGQELSILTELDPNSSVRALKKLIDVRDEAFKLKFKNQPATQVVEKTVKEIQSRVKPPNKYDWNAFLSSISC